MGDQEAAEALTPGKLPHCAHSRVPGIPTQHGQAPAAAAASHVGAGWGTEAGDRGPGSTLWSEALRTGIHPGSHLHLRGIPMEAVEHPGSRRDG